MSESRSHKTRPIALRTVRAPEIGQAGIVWLNTTRPLSLADLRGRLVVLDFWTSCCINCLQIQPTLAALEARFGDRIAIIGIHSPKFTAERDLDKLAAAIQRYGITHPVAHDPEFAIWRSYTVRAWPTLVFVAPDGYVLGSVAGEPDPTRLIAGIEKLLAGGAADSLAPLPLAISPTPASRLNFPGKLKPVAGGRWALADGGHHQIVLLDDRGTELARYGSGAAGFVDGSAGDARFDRPQGLVADENALIIADTGNHALRRIDLADGTVTTLAGTGSRGRPLGTKEAGKRIALASPWDVERLDDGIAFANAGTHQLGHYDPATGSVSRLAGSGREAILDGTIEEAALAQPSGLALSPDRARLYFLDSETSSLRVLRLDRGRVETLIGSGLFDFGRHSGAFADATLQHPLGLAVAANRIYIADTYNDAIRLADLATGTLSELDDGFLCQDRFCLPLAEPAGIALAGPNRLLLVDTNNHRVLEYDLARRAYHTWLA